MKLSFHTPVQEASEGTFGGASFGFVGSEDPSHPLQHTYPVDLQGTMLLGNYDEILSQLPQTSFQAGIVLLGNAGNENQFIRTLADKLKVPLVGGAAATHPVTGQGGLISGKRQAAVFLIQDTRYRVEVCSTNIHDVLSRHRIGFTNPRILETIDGEDAVTWYQARRSERNLGDHDFEHLTLTDLHGINAHLSLVNGMLCSGRDLDHDMDLRFLSSNLVHERMQCFYDDCNAIIFGCAGLKSILPQTLHTKGLGLFMFGEVCTIDGHSDFGNLMLSKIRIIPVD